MKINRFIAKDVHGYLNFDINFRDQLTFLIGINGAGKTTALKLLIGLITPSFRELSKITCSYAELVCSNDENIRIILERNEEQALLKLVVGNKETNGEFQVLPDESDIEMSPELYREKYATFKERFLDLEVVSKIEKLLTPHFLGLNRQIASNSSRQNRLSLSRGISYRAKVSGQTDNGLLEVQQLIYDYTRQIARQQLRISNNFKNKIFRNSFHFVDSSDVFLQNISEELPKLKLRNQALNEAIDGLEIGDISDEIDLFFRNMEDTIEKINEMQASQSDDDSLRDPDVLSYYTKLFINSHQLNRIDEIIDLSNDYQAQIKKLREPIERLEELANRFLSESNKLLKVSGEGEIKVIIQKPHRTQVNTIYELSSGERQIVIMIAHLIFSTNLSKSPIFVIDEPELSLHIAWQEIFVDSIIKASPNTQFILATHSPSIISRVEWETLCEDLTKRDIA